jgi:hypothetical protein
MAAVGILSGCAKVPYADFRGYSSQPKVLSASHWGTLAESSASEIAGVYKKLSAEMGTSAPAGVFVPEMPQDSSFYRSYGNQLKQALVKEGVPVRTSGRNSLVVNVSAETYLYSRRTGGRIPFTNNTMFAVLAAYVPEWIADSSWSDLRAGFISLVAIFDVLKAKSHITDAEAMVITTIEVGDSLLFMSNKPFYIEPRDLLLYWTDHPTTAVMSSGVDRGTTAPLKTIRVVQ